MLRWLFSHGITMFVATLAFFVVLAIAAWIAVGYGAAIIVAVAGLIWVAIALPQLMVYFDQTDNPSSGRYPDALR